MNTTTKNMKIGLTAEELQTLWHACFILSDLRKTLESQQAHGLNGWKDFKFSYECENVQQIECAVLKTVPGFIFYKSP